MSAPLPLANPSRLLSVRPLLEPLEDRCLPAVLTWINASGGSWHNPFNWDAGRLPGSGDDVVIALPGVRVSYTTGTATVRSLIGSETLRLSGGTLHALAASRLGTLELSGGTLTVWNDLDVTDELSWSGGKLAGSGKIDVLGDTAVWGTKTRWLDRVRLHTSGAVEWSGGWVRSANGAVLVNEADAVFSVVGGVRFDAAFQNAGTFVFAAPGSVPFAAFANAGEVRLERGTLRAAAYEQTAGQTQLSGGVLAANSTVTLAGGTLTGGGTVDSSVLNSAALVRPDTGQTLHVTGDYTQLAGGQLALVVSGVSVLGILTLPTGDSAPLRVGETASLDGVLSAQVSGATVPGQRYDLVSAADRQGQFAQVQTWPLPGLAYNVEYAADGADLVTSVAVPKVENAANSLPPAAVPGVMPSAGGSTARPTPAGSGAGLTTTMPAADAFRGLLVPAVQLTSQNGAGPLVETMTSSADLGQTASSRRAASLSLASAERSATGGESPELSDEVFVEFALAPPELPPPTEEELGVGDVLGALLGAGRVRADLLPQSDGRLSLVAALVSGGEGGAGLAATSSPLAELLIDPVTGGAGACTAADVALVQEGIAEQSPSRALMAMAGLLGLTACVWAGRGRQGRRVGLGP